MDELDIFKKQWKKEEKNLPRLKYDEIYQMILKRSSSAVKWIFIISILELAFGMIMNAFWHPAFLDNIEEPVIVKIVGWGLLPLGVYFIYRFFKNYQNVSATSSVKELMDNIMKARNTARIWIIINMIVAGVFAFSLSISMSLDTKGGWEAFKAHAELSDYLLVFGVSFVVSVLIVGIFLAIYLLLYGLLIRKLNINYRELRKMEL